MGTSEMDDLRACFLRVRAVVDEGIARIEALSPKPPPVAEGPVYMKIKDYAARRNVSESTVRRWLQLGLPKDQRGKVVRVVLPDADQWDERKAVQRLVDIAGARTR